MADAHIFPQALTRGLVDDPGKEAIYSIPLDDREPEKRNRTGLWDDTIMCLSCEGRFQTYDQCGVETLREDPPALSGVKTCLLRIDSKRLKLFFLHVLWRSHASRHPELAAARLRPEVAEHLRQMLLTDAAGSEIDFSTLLCVVPPDPDGMDKFSTTYRRERWPTGVTRLHMQYQRWLVFVTPPNGTPPPDFVPYLLGGTGPARILFGGEFRETLGFRALARSIGRRRRNPPSRRSG